MAGDWIKMRVNLPSDPQVIKISRLLDCSEFKVVGLLHWLWGWADAHTEDGRAVGIDCLWINRQAGVEGFCEALVQVGWLLMHEDGIEIPNFAHHNGASAKTRANTARRAANFKNRQTPTTNGPKEPVRTEKPRKTFGKVDPIVKLLEGPYAHLLIGDKEEDLKLWVNHLSQRLPKTYSDAGARALLKRIDEMDADELHSGVEFSLESNYQKLVVPKEYKKNDGPKRFEEYPE
jgi:hypothetical protein